jgi:hypothetical protein
MGRAKDGDSLMVGNTDVRLFGIDAPEFDQSCSIDGRNWSSGAAAADQLSKLVTGKHVVCASVGTDEHKREIWARTFQTPSGFRHSPDAPTPIRTERARKRSAPKTAATDWQGRASANCTIKGKGNRNRKDKGSIICPGCPITTRGGPKRYSAPRPKPEPRVIAGRL